ncbi:imidazole glycerol phosphate synthase subunit HisF [Lottiidibacillus patelloidae]|uniref:Imidazole glycerol phosphate synthase subunit HisF n=1 Tax=Lottiidibacillus patelloidae TaxID=2670334 RepID=A0A263BTI8_9BACI|nr:imidazole glycerol phosphate synthase subunit HisF [Lottiidibacillus patelloidae]OZM56995.1 imidazole glycerol phosphate synthase subunit HisF [Lottiidibacillus patelloidae]
MLTKRIIPCLDVRNGRVVKGKKFKDIVDVDSPEVLGAFYSETGADELVFYDITATHEERQTSLEFVRKVAETIHIPFSVGGGVNTLADFANVLRLGADKVSINSAAVKNPSLIKEAALKYGSQCVVLSIDAKQKESGKWSVYVNGGRVDTGLDAIEWAKKGVSLGAGEIVINSIDSDGVKNGYDIALLKAITDVVQVPVIASGGAGTKEHFYEAVDEANVDGILAASVFHFGEIPIIDLKVYLKERGIEVRL